MKAAARSLLAVGLTLAACAAPGPPQPLSAILIRTQLVGRTVAGAERGRDFFIYFAPNGVAALGDETVEFGQWHTGDRDDLCLKWHGRPEQCAPVYQINGGRYRFGDVYLNVLGPF